MIAPQKKKVWGQQGSKPWKIETCGEFILRVHWATIPPSLWGSEIRRRPEHLNFLCVTHQRCRKDAKNHFFENQVNAPTHHILLENIEHGQSALLLLVVCIRLERPDVYTELCKHNTRTTWHARSLSLYTRWFLYDIDMWFMYSFDYFTSNLPHASRFSYFKLLSMQICSKTIKFWVVKVAELV